MNTTLTLKNENPTLYVPEKVKIIETKEFTSKEKFFKLELVSGQRFDYDPGQFIQLSILGIGEAPISITSVPARNSTFEICVRAVGDVTNHLHALTVGDEFFIRGPFGHGFTPEICQSFLHKHLVFLVGGLGYVPARSLINHVINTATEYEKISIIYGCKTPSMRMYPDELAEIAKIGNNVELIEIVDNVEPGWHGHQGIITKAIPLVTMDPVNTRVIIIGPPVIYRFAVVALSDRKIPPEHIYMSLERRMKCGVGKCGHCQMEGIYVCQEGPVFNYADIKNNEEAL